MPQGSWGRMAAHPTCGRSPHLLPGPHKGTSGRHLLPASLPWGWAAEPGALQGGEGKITRTKKGDGPPRPKREEIQSVGRRRGVLINKTGEKVIQIEARKGWRGWGTGQRLQHRRAGLGQGWAAGWAQQPGCTVGQMAKWWPNPLRVTGKFTPSQCNRGAACCGAGAEPQPWPPALPSPWHRTALVLASHCIALALPWHCPGIALASCWHRTGTALAPHWHRTGIAGTRLAEAHQVPPDEPSALEESHSYFQFLPIF